MGSRVDADDSYQRWLHSEPVTAEEARALIASCLTCSECPEPRVAPHDHHWIEHSVDPDDADAVDDFKASHPQLVADDITEDLLLYHVGCKHCPAVKAIDDSDDDLAEVDPDELVVDSLDPAELDPGIRDLVVALRARRWHTTDSGDGVSKPPEERTLHQPHVVVRINRDFMADDAQRLRDAVEEITGEPVVAGGGRGWTVEAVYHPVGDIAFAIVQRWAEQVVVFAIAQKSEEVADG